MYVKYILVNSKEKLTRKKAPQEVEAPPPLPKSTS